MADTITQSIISEETKARLFPRYAVILHNDDVHDVLYVMRSLQKAIPGLQNAEEIVIETDREGRAIVIICVKEIAELYEDRIKTFGLIVSIEPAT